LTTLLFYSISQLMNMDGFKQLKKLEGNRSSN